MVNHKNSLQLFVFQSHRIRVTVDKEGEPWFVASDVARVLGYRESYHATRILPENEKGPQIVGTPGGPQEITTVSEPGLYRLVTHSRRPEAERFRLWVFHEVLPQIRKTGSYGKANIDLRDIRQLAPVALQLAEIVQEQNAQLAAARPKVDAYDALIDATGLSGLQQTAKKLGLPPNKFIGQLQAEGYLFRREGKLVPYQRWQNAGYFEVKNIATLDKKARIQTFVTQRGLDHLYRKFVHQQRLPAVVS